jgi:hypothetical protein
VTPDQERKPRKRGGGKRGGRRRRAGYDPIAEEALQAAGQGCRCARCYSGAEFFRAEFGNDYGLFHAAGEHDPNEAEPLDAGRKRDPYYCYRAAQLVMAEKRNQDEDRRRREDREAQRRGLEPLTYEDRHPIDGLRARRYW